MSAGTKQTFAHTLLALLAVGAVVLGSLPASAYDAGKLGAAKIAAAAFVSAAKNSENTGDAPRESDPGAKSLLDAVFDVRDLDSGEPVPFQALTALSERMMAGIKVGLVYMLAGTGASDLSQIGADPDAAEKVNRNVIKFAPEMGRFFDFELSIQGAVVNAVQARLASATPADLARPNFQSGLADIRQGTARTVSGVIETLAVKGLSEDWRRARLPALAAIAPRLATFLQPEQKQQLKEIALACADVMDDAEMKSGLQAFAHTVSGG